MARQHKHWPVDHPRYASAPFCDLPTKRECDVRFAAWKREQKRIYEDALADQMVRQRNSSQVAFDLFMQKESIRVADILRQRGDSAAEVH
jgi:hypothetical protein